MSQIEGVTYRRNRLLVRKARSLSSSLEGLRRAMSRVWSVHSYSSLGHHLEEDSQEGEGQEEEEEEFLLRILQMGRPDQCQGTPHDVLHPPCCKSTSLLHPSHHSPPIWGYLLLPVPARWICTFPPVPHKRPTPSSVVVFPRAVPAYPARRPPQTELGVECVAWKLEWLAAPGCVLLSIAPVDHVVLASQTRSRLCRNAGSLLRRCFEDRWCKESWTN